jgi:ABC-type amino acid transport substrate-binding protein
VAWTIIRTGSAASRCARRTRRPLVAGVAAAALLVSVCGSGQSGAAGSSFDPVEPGVLTVATAFVPAPGFWEGNPPTKGFEAGLAAALVRHIGLDRVHVVQVPFDSIIHGHFGGADLALSQMTPTEEREQSVDFTEPYVTAPPGVLARPGR